VPAAARKREPAREDAELTAKAVTPEPFGSEVASPAVDAAEVATSGTKSATSAKPEPSAPRLRALRDLAATLGIAVLAFLVGLIVFNSLIMPRVVHHQGEVRVPDLSRMSYEQAEKLLARSGLHLSRAGERFDPAVPRGGVLTQEPLANTSVRGGARVSVTVSLGQESSVVPALAGQTRRTAELIVERAGLRVGSVTVVPSDEVPEGMVVASDPPAETVLPNGATVALLVSMGPADEALVMPDMIGRPLAPIVRQLESQGFTVLAPAGDGPIVSQDPPAGSRLTRETPITLRAGRRVVR